MTREPATPAPLWTRAEIEALGAQVLAKLAPNPETDRERRYFETDTWLAVEAHLLNALAALGAAAGTTGEPGLLPVLVRWLDEAEAHDWRELNLVGDLAAALERCAAPSLPADDRGRRLAAHPADRIRLAVARSLDVAEAAAQAVLARLVEDADPEVQQVARLRLGEVRDLPWWQGYFARDPFADVEEPAAQARRQTAVETLVGWFELPSWRQGGALGAALAAVDALPDDLAVPVLRRMAGRHDLRARADHGIEVRLLARPGGAVAWWSALVEGRRVEHEAIFVHVWIERVSAPARQEAALLVARECRTLVDGEARRAAPWLVSLLWPPGVDPTPLCSCYEALLGHDDVALRAASCWTPLFAAAGLTLPSPDGWGEA